MRLFHTTSEEAATAILRDGFHDAAGSYGFVSWSSPVCSSPIRPWGFNEGAVDDPVVGAPVLVVEIPEEVIAEHEIIEDAKPEGVYREWIVPAELANGYGRPKVIRMTEDGWSDGYAER